MTMEVRGGDWSQVEVDWLVAVMAESDETTGSIAALDESLGGALTRLGEAGDFTGKLAKTLALHDVPAIAAKRLLLVGVGDLNTLSLARLDKALMTAGREISDKAETSVAVGFADDVVARMSVEFVVQSAATALTVSAVGQDLYKQEPGRFSFKSVQILLPDGADAGHADAGLARGAVLGEAVNLTRELVNRPAQEIYPESVAQRAEELAQQTGLTCTILDQPALEEEKMETLLAVARGSDRPARVVILEHRGGDDDDPTLALVGKGVTFDSGGLSLKPNDGMKTMKCDMAGAATVLGAMSAIAQLDLPVNVTGYLGLVENLVSGSSYKLGDVLTARNGKTIEVLNTDAEGRLVLADVLALAVDRGATRIVDLATLTGACIVALGEEVTGVFSNDEQWCDELFEASARADELVWQMPMFDLFGELIKGDVSDLKNVGPRWGGAVTAAKFLENFVGETPWVHLDIAGPAFASSAKPHRDGGATGCMVRTLVELADMYGT